MKKIFLFLLVVLSLSSCFDEKAEERPYNQIILLEKNVYFLPTSDKLQKILSVFIEKQDSLGFEIKTSFKEMVYLPKYNSYSEGTIIVIGSKK